MSLEVECTHSAFEEICRSLMNDRWYPCARGYWLDSHEHEELGYAWQHFVQTVKHEQRYFFGRRTTAAQKDVDDEIQPAELLERILRLVTSLDLVRQIDDSVDLYRVRLVKEDESLETLKEMGPPPTKKAGAGRLNPAGISYCYLTLERETGLAEVISRPPCRAAVGRLRVRRSVRLVDLSDLPPLPSIFDSSQRDLREHLIFLQQFVNEIAKPIAKDGREHVNYVPSQIVSEFMALPSHPDSSPFDGILFPSAVRNGGNNVALFPPRDLLKSWNDLLVVVEIEHVNIDTWDSLIVQLDA